MLTKYIPQNIQEKLKAKERALERAKKPDEQEGYMSFQSMASRTIFVRMCSNKVNAEDNQMIDGGFNNDLERKPFGFASIYRESITANGDRFGKRPVAGIKNIEVQYKGGFKAIRECTVSWVVPSLDDLELFQDHFFTVGKTVIVDWGWVYSDGNVDVQLADSFITRETPTGGRPSFKVKQDIFTNPQTRISSMNGDYDAIGGQVTNFETSLRSDGGFDCTTKIISMGASLFKRPLDAGGNQSGIKVKGQTVNRLPVDSLINCVINLESIILSSVFNISNVKDLYTPGKADAFVGEFIGLFSDSSKQFSDNISIQQNIRLAGLSNNKGFIKKHRVKGKDNNYAFLVDDKTNPQVLWVCSNVARVNFFVTWGWMEDNIISRYTSFLGGSEKDRNVKMLLRSLDPVFDKNGNTIPISKTDNSYDEKISVNADLVNELSNIGENNTDNILKESVQIRKPPFLLPVEPFKFFTSGIGESLAMGLGNGGGGVQDQFYKDFFNIGDEANFRKFAKTGEDVRTGSLRNVWVNVEEIQKAFGIKYPRSNDTSTNNVNPPGTLEVAINNLLNQLNTNFHDVWNFELVTDPYNPTNIKVIDNSDSEIEEPKYTEYLENSHKVQTNGVFQFPSFKRGSMVKNQTLNFKIPDAQALTILYGSNKKDGNTEQEFLNGQLEKIFEIKKDRKKDKFLADLETSKYSGDGKSLNTNVGSLSTSPNSKIGIGDAGKELKFGIKIDPTSWKNWWKLWKPELEGDDEEKKEEKTEKSVKNLYGFLSDSYYEIITNEETNLPQVVEVKDKKNSPTEYYLNKNHVISMKGEVQRVLKSYMHASSPIAQFDMSNLVPAELGLEIDGTGGITPFDVIHTEYIQGIYKSDITVENFVMSEQDVRAQNTTAENERYNEDFTEGDFSDENINRRTTDDQLATTPTRIGPLTFFQIKDVKHTLDESGWKTEITSVMRINRIQRFDKISGLVIQDKKLGDITYETQSPPLETLQEPFPEDATPDNIDDLTFEDIQEFPDIPIPQTKVLDANISPTKVKKEIEKVQETSPPTEDNAFILPGQIIGDRRVNTDPDLNRQVAEDIRNSGRPVYNFDYTPFDFGTPKAEDPPIKLSAPVAKAYGKKLELNRMPFADLPIPEKVDQIAIPEVKRHIYVQPKQQVDLREYGTVKQVKGSTFTDMRFAKLTTKEFEAPVEVTIQATEPIQQAKLSEEIVVEQLPLEIVIRKSTYNPSWPDWATNPTFKLIYKIVPGWYTKSNNNPKNTSFYGEPPTSAVAKRFRQKFWDEVIEMPNETGTTALDTTAAINARLAEIGDTYKDLGPYDTWKPITGLDYASYNPTTGKADYTENGVKIVLPKGTN